MGFLKKRGRRDEAQQSQGHALAVLRDLALPSDDRTAETLLTEYVRQVRGKQLVLSRDPLAATPGGPSGMWIPGPDHDLVWVHPAAGDLLRDRVLLHELGHMVNGDEPDPVSLEDVMRLLQGMFQHVSPALLKSALCRTNFSDPRERHAEEFSAFAQGWLRRPYSGSHDIVDNMRECLETRTDQW
ncbi:hypothetical protein [Streptomyces albidoflavus]|uniref:hypothetical protein n=1 Tax=Streptomyces albidoflavus TaxID=1886 RepID=UPI0033C9755B